MKKFTKSIKQYKAQIQNMRAYLKDLEQRKFTPQKNVSCIQRSQVEYQVSPTSSLRKRSIMLRNTSMNSHITLNYFKETQVKSVPSLFRITKTLLLQTTRPILTREGILIKNLNNRYSLYQQEVHHHRLANVSLTTMIARAISYKLSSKPCKFRLRI